MTSESFSPPLCLQEAIWLGSVFISPAQLNNVFWKVNHLIILYCGEYWVYEDDKDSIPNLQDTAVF